jgi:HSP90 family molecular chaperone
LTFEFDKNNELLSKLNKYRREDADEASLIIRQLFDNACLEAGLESDSKNMINRINKLLGKIIDGKVNKIA